LQVPDAHRPNRQAHQLQYFAPNGFDHAPHLTVAALGNHDFEKRVSGRIADACHNGRARGTVIQHGATAQAVELFLAEQRGRFHQIRLGQLVVGVGDALGEIGVVGEDEQAAGVEVQTADG